MVLSRQYLFTVIHTLRHLYHFLINIQLHPMVIFHTLFWVTPLRLWSISFGGSLLVADFLNVGVLKSVSLWTHWDFLDGWLVSPSSSKEPCWTEGRLLRARGTDLAKRTWARVLGFASCFMGLPGGSTGKESICLQCNAGDPGSIPESSRRPPERGNGNPLQYSCLENPMDWRARRATVHGVTERQTPLSNT